MFFITAFQELDSEIGGIKNSRCFGYYPHFETANNAVKNNMCDINETIYDYAVIENIEPGIHSIYTDRWFYKFNYKTGMYESIEEPKEVMHFCNFAIG